MRQSALLVFSILLIALGACTGVDDGRSGDGDDDGTTPGDSDTLSADDGGGTDSDDGTESESGTTPPGDGMCPDQVQSFIWIANTGSADINPDTTYLYFSNGICNNNSCSWGNL